jgi:hypothetical protein
MAGEGSTSTKTHEKPTAPASNAISAPGPTFSPFRPFTGSTTLTARHGMLRGARIAR